MVWSFFTMLSKIKNTFIYGLELFNFLIIKHLGIVTNLLLDRYCFYTLYLWQQNKTKRT